MNTITIILTIVVALVVVIASKLIKNKNYKEELKKIDLDPKDFYRVYVGTTKMNGKTICVAEGRYQEVYERLRYFKHNNPGTSGWAIHPARSGRS